MQLILIDDDSITNFINKEVLNLYDGSLLVKDFTNAIDAITYLKKSEVSSFLIFLDINMPIMSGWDFLDELKNLNLKHEIDITLLSSSINESDRTKAFSYSLVKNYFEKPLSRKDLDKCL
jgi:CheY-like chemotaxis protein